MAAKLVDKLDRHNRADVKSGAAVIVGELPVPARGNRITYDTEVKGFGVRVTAAGARARSSSTTGTSMGSSAG
jgi:hypothetical protein